MGRIERSFTLVAQSYRILMQDKELMVLPLISGVIGLVIIGVVGGGWALTPFAVEPGPAMYVPLFCFYVVMYAIGIFFQAAVIAGATERMRGGDPTIGSALAAAMSKAVPILMWALVSATVGVILRAIQDRVGFIGKIVTGLAGAAWGLATFFVVPVLVLEDRSIGDAFQRSANVFKETWGETMIGGAGLGVAGFFAWLALFAVTGVLALLMVPLAIVFFCLGAVGLIVFFSALQGVYVASLFRYATEGGNTTGFDSSLLQSAFVPKK